MVCKRGGFNTEDEGQGKKFVVLLGSPLSPKLPLQTAPPFLWIINGATYVLNPHLSTTTIAYYHQGGELEASSTSRRQSAGDRFNNGGSAIETSSAPLRSTTPLMGAEMATVSREARQNSVLDRRISREVGGSVKGLFGRRKVKHECAAL